MSILDTSETLRPIYEAKPDLRFATTFLSNKYRDYAVKGETIQDKVTGEIFTKRKEDGRVVSFFQNKKYLHDMMLELRVLLNNNAEFRYPGEEDINAYYLSTDYDIMSIYDETDVDITGNDIIIPNTTDTSVHQVQFKISKKSNGFFCRMTSRDSDKAIIEWVTNQYNAMLKNYTGSNSVFSTESEKFKTITKWEDSNAVLNYTVTIIRDEGTLEYTFDDYIRVNEESCITFPATLGSETLASATSITITINSVKFDKLHFMLTYKALLPSEFITGYEKFIYPDNAIYVRYMNICSFVDQSTDVELLGNEFIIALVDIPYVYRYMMKMSKLVDSSTFILSPNRPGDDLWKPNGIWAEHVRDVFKTGVEVNMECEVDLKQLEDYLSENDDTDYVEITTDATKVDDIYGEQV